MSVDRGLYLVVDTTGLVSVVSSILVGDGSGSSSCSGVLAITPDGEIGPTAPKVIHAAVLLKGMSSAMWRAILSNLALLRQREAHPSVEGASQTAARQPGLSRSAGHYIQSRDLRLLRLGVVVSE